MNPLVRVVVTERQEDLLDRAIEALYHPVALWMVGGREELLDVHDRMQPLHELVAELWSVVCQDATGDSIAAEHLVDQRTSSISHGDLLHGDSDRPMRVVIDDDEDVAEVFGCREGADEIHGEELEGASWRVDEASASDDLAPTCFDLLARPTCLHMMLHISEEGRPIVSSCNLAVRTLDAEVPTEWTVVKHVK